MGSPLGVLFANMYMSKIEERAFHQSPPPGIYARYIDDIFITTTDEEDVPAMINALQNNSCLTFTSEYSIEGRLPFLDVDIQKHESGFKTKVYTKATNMGRCLNARGECPIQYKRSVAAAYVNRALTHCNNWTDTHRELDRIRQLLTNNGFPDSLIENIIKEKLEKFTNTTQERKPKLESIVIYHRSTFHNRYKEESNALKNIINRGAHPTNSRTNIVVRIYNKPNLTRSLFMRNSTAPRQPKEVTTNVVYKFTCPESLCEGSNSYVGRTSSTLRRRLQSHRSQGSIFQHYTEIHDMRPPLQKLLENTEIIHRESNFRKLQIAEAVSITLQHPSLNIQQNADFILPSICPMNLSLHQEKKTTLTLTNQREGPTTRQATRALNRATNQHQAHLSLRGGQTS